MKLLKRIAITVCAAVFVFALVPASSFAVDPVSAATMANAFAQAITAYGASQGVSMTFDVSNTDGIGEGVHELWDQYKEDLAQSNVTVSDYSNLAASVFPTLWTKTFGYVTANLDAAVMGEVDGFWNWLLSGPAEMTKVDNQYYEWTVDSVTGVVDPIIILNTGGYFPGSPVPYISSPATNVQTFNASTKIGVQNNGINNVYPAMYTTSSSQVGYLCIIPGSNDSTFQIVSLAPTSSVGYYYITYDPANSSYSLSSYQSGSSLGSKSGYYARRISSESRSSWTSVYLHEFSSYGDAIDTLVGLNNNTITDIGSNISVQPYVGDTAPQNVYIPDNTDVNYTPVAVEIPLDILWDDSLFGDGAGTLTDAQSEAITKAADDAITDNPDKTLELADTAPAPPVPDPSEVYIPLLPVTLPSFNFSFSGIWHYVVTWVGSLGSWLTLMFSVWNSLPYAIVIPVYASAVVVIIIGTLKRFL